LNAIEVEGWELANIAWRPKSGAWWRKDWGVSRVLHLQAAGRQRKMCAMLTFLREWLWRCIVGWVVFRMRRRASSAARSAAFGLARKRVV